MLCQNVAIITGPPPSLVPACLSPRGNTPCFYVFNILYVYNILKTHRTMEGLQGAGILHVFFFIKTKCMRALERKKESKKEIKWGSHPPPARSEALFIYFYFYFYFSINLKIKIKTPPLPGVYLPHTPPPLVGGGSGPGVAGPHHSVRCRGGVPNLASAPK